MFSWLLAVPFIGSFIQIITPAVKGIVEGLVEWAKAIWHGVKTSNYGTWTLVLTTAALVWLFTTCPDQKCSVAKPSISTSKIQTNEPKNDWSFNPLEWLGH